jgi:hypothetical protein
VKPRQLLRTAAAAGAIGEAVVHIPVTPDHLVEAPYVGVGFVLLTVAGILLAVLLLEDDEPWVWWATGGVAVAALLGYLLSRTVGLPQLHDDIGAWNDPLGTLAITCEALMLGCALVRALLPTRRRVAPRRRDHLLA